MSEDECTGAEFRIDDPESRLKDEENRLREKEKRADAIEFALKMTLIEQKDDLDVDNIFQITNGDMTYCVLTNILPCRKPHCMSCHLPILCRKEAEHYLAYTSKITMEKHIRESRKKLDREASKFFEKVLKDIDREIDGE